MRIEEKEVMTMKKNIFCGRIISLLLVAMLAIIPFVMASCNNGNAEEEGVTLVSVVRATKDIEEGEKISADSLEVIQIRDVDAPINAIAAIEDVADKYARTKILAGDFLLPAKLVATLENEGDGVIGEADNSIKYTLIGDYSDLVNNGDYTAAIKKAIEDNPGGTIYFPDGEYTVSESIVISAAPDKCVSFRLSAYATIKAASTWADKTAPVIRLGVGALGDDILDSRNVSLTGGVIDGAGVAYGLSIEGGRDILVSNMAINNAPCGIHIKSVDNAVNDVGADIENVNIMGDGSADSVGILVEGSNNNLTNIRAFRVSAGMKCTESGSDNIFRSIGAIATESAASDAALAGFVDLSTGNHYDACYSDQFATGFSFGTEARSVYNDCFVTWRGAENGYHVGFGATGKLNAVISNCTVGHTDDVATDAYILVAEEGGEGVVLYPINKVQKDTHNGVLEQYCPTEILK